jgi:hypothetical protein
MVGERQHHGTASVHYFFIQLVSLLSAWYHFNDSGITISTLQVGMNDHSHSYIASAHMSLLFYATFLVMEPFHITELAWFTGAMQQQHQQQQHCRTAPLHEYRYWFMFMIIVEVLCAIVRYDRTTRDVPMVMRQHTLVCAIINDACSSESASAAPEASHPQYLWIVITHQSAFRQESLASNFETAFSMVLVCLFILMVYTVTVFSFFIFRSVEWSETKACTVLSILTTPHCMVLRINRACNSDRKLYLLCVVTCVYRSVIKYS